MPQPWEKLQVGFCVFLGTSFHTIERTNKVFFFLHEAYWNVTILEASPLLSSSDRNWPIYLNVGGRRLTWPELQNSLKEKIPQIPALCGRSMLSNTKSGRICYGQVTTGCCGKYVEFSGSSDELWCSESTLQSGCSHQCAGISLLKLALHFQFRQSLCGPAMVK